MRVPAAHGIDQINPPRLTLLTSHMRVFVPCPGASCACNLCLPQQPGSQWQLCTPSLSVYIIPKAGHARAQVDGLIVNCTAFNPTPSLSAAVVNHFKFKSSIRTFNLSGMGCAASVIAVDMAREMLKACFPWPLPLPWPGLMVRPGCVPSPVSWQAARRTCCPHKQMTCPGPDAPMSSRFWGVLSMGAGSPLPQRPAQKLLSHDRPSVLVTLLTV